MFWMCIRIDLDEGDSNTHPQHMILWRNVEIFTFYHFDSDPDLGSFLYGDVSVMESEIASC